LSNHHRITAGVTRPTPVPVCINGKWTHAYPGESVMAALLGQGVRIFRHTASGMPRAPVCNMGVCFECVVTINGKPMQRSCLTPIQDGMVIETDTCDSPTLPKLPNTP